MTFNKKLETMKLQLHISEMDETEKPSDELLSSYLTMSAKKILNKRFPFEYKASKLRVPDRYADLQIELAIILYAKDGVQGETNHTESGVSRTYRTESEILSEIPAYVGTLL